MTWTHGTFYWNELMTRDVDKARAFYETTIGWRFEPMTMMDGMTYWVAKDGERPVGGIMAMPAGLDGVPEHWMSYIAVDDVDKRVKVAEKAGASIVRPAFDVPGVGRIAILKDGGGAVIGWMTPAQK